MVFACKKFRYYLLGYKTFFHTDHSALTQLVNKPDLSGRIARWILLLQEFDHEVIVRKGKAHTNADFLSRLRGEKQEESVEDSFPDEQLFHIEGEATQYGEIIAFLLRMEIPPGMTYEQKAVFVHNMAPFTLLHGVLHKLGPDLKLRRCLEKKEVRRVLEALHNDPEGGHFALTTTLEKIKMVGYWWPTMHNDALEYIRSCDACQRQGKPLASAHWPLTPIMPLAPFEKWGIDYVGPFIATKQRRNKWIIIATDYATKWVEAEATRKGDAEVTATFLFNNIITRFGYPLELVGN